MLWDLFIATCLVAVLCIMPPLGLILIIAVLLNRGRQQ